MKKEMKLYDVPRIDSIQDMIVKSARKYGDKLALEDIAETPMRRVSYEVLLRNILKFGTALRKLGIP